MLFNSQEHETDNLTNTNMAISGNIFYSFDSYSQSNEIPIFLSEDDIYNEDYKNIENNQIQKEENNNSQNNFLPSENKNDLNYSTINDANEEKNKSTIQNLCNIQIQKNPDKNEKTENKVQSYQNLTNLEIIQDNKNNENEKNKKETTLLGKKTERGRKEKTCREKGRHTAFSEDNMIIKIKTFLINTVIIDWLNKNGLYKFFKIKEGKDSCISNITRKDNIELLNKKVKDILRDYPNTSKNLDMGKKNSSHNKEIVEKILKENKEEEIIQFLNYTLKEILNKSKNKELGLKYSIEMFKERLKGRYENQEREDTKNFDEYWKNIERLIYSYESWFEGKKSRKPKKIKMEVNNEIKF